MKYNTNIIYSTAVGQQRYRDERILSVYSLISETACPNVTKFLVWFSPPPAMS